MFEQEEKEGPVEGKKYTYNNVPGMYEPVPLNFF